MAKGRQKSKGRRWIVGIAVLAACAAAAGGYVITRGWPGTASAADETAASVTTSASAPAPVEPTAVAPDEPNPSSGQTVATDEPVVVETEVVPVVLTYSAWSPADRQVLAGGYVAGVIEDGGVCTLTLTNGSATVTVDGPAMPDATTTVCTGLSVPGERLSAGTWQATLAYESPTHRGTSAAAPVEVAA
jgi:hypothetical protein